MIILLWKAIFCANIKTCKSIRPCWQLIPSNLSEHNYSKSHRTWKGEICAIHNPPKTQTEDPCHHIGQVTGVAKKDPFSTTEVKVTLKLDHDVILSSGWKHLPLDTSLPAWYAALYGCSCPCWSRYPDPAIFLNLYFQSIFCQEIYGEQTMFSSQLLLQSSASYFSHLVCCPAGGSN